MVKQDLKSLKKGLYSLRAWVRNTGGQKACQLIVMNTETEFSVRIPQTFNWEWKQVELKVPVTDGKCTIGIKTHNKSSDWLAIDKVEFVRISGEK